MSSTLSRRVKSLEVRTPTESLAWNREEAAACLKRDLAAECLSEQQAIAKFGSLPAFVYHLLCRDVKQLGELTTDESDGLTACERYMRMLDG